MLKNKQFENFKKFAFLSNKFIVIYFDPWCEDQDTQLQGRLGNYIAFLKHVAERRKEKLTQNAPNDTKIKIIKNSFEKT